MVKNKLLKQCQKIPAFNYGSFGVFPQAKALPLRHASSPGSLSGQARDAA
jgi:hypothetical protein